MQVRVHVKIQVGQHTAVELIPRRHFLDGGLKLLNAGQMKRILDAHIFWKYNDFSFARPHIAVDDLVL